MNMSTLEEWLAGLVEGDEVWFVDRFNAGNICRITRTTRTQVFIGSQGFYRRNGEVVGGRKHGVWSSAIIRPITEENRLLVELRELRRFLEGVLVSSKTTLPELRAMKVALDSTRLRMQTMRKEAAEKDNQ